MVISGNGSDQKLAFLISGGPLGGILDQFGHLVAEIGDLALSGTKVPKKAQLLNECVESI